ncbi:MAG TPA: ribosome-recycling factor, partial [Mariprofundaceae bacterium]|nr:ribosome-recycling factor [Mariprofundaceae bacterium]
IPVIEKAILSSDLGLNPSNDGAAIRIVLPELTEERRREFVKQVRQYGEKAKVAVRNIRRDANDDVKRKIKDEGISEDEGKRLADQIQKVTDRYIHEIDQVIEHKEKDILTL